MDSREFVTCKCYGYQPLVLLILSIFIALSGKRPLPENGFSKTEDNQNNSLSSNAPSNDRNSTPELYSVPNQPAKSQAADRDLSTQNIRLNHSQI